MKHATRFSAAFFSLLLFAASAHAAGKKLYGELDQWASICNTAGIKLKGGQVEKVMLGTPAYFAGLRDNDKVLNCNVGEKTLRITFDRGGKRYAVTVPIDPSAMQPGITAAEPPRPKFTMGETQALQKLRDYDVVVFLDCSGSMGEGIRSENTSKWNWAAENVQDFNAKFNEVVKRQITLVTFNDKFRVIPNCTTRDLEAVFKQREPEGGTDLAEPLQTILDERLRALQQRPCIIVVLHDGISDNEERVKRILEKTAADLFSPGKIHVTFIQIGDDAAGSENLREMEDANYGGKDLVKAELFDDIKKQGLARAIAAAINTTMTAPATPAPAKTTAKPKTP